MDGADGAGLDWRTFRSFDAMRQEAKTFRLQTSLFALITLFALFTLITLLTLLTLFVLFTLITLLTLFTLLTFLTLFALFTLLTVLLGNACSHTKHYLRLQLSCIS